MAVLDVIKKVHTQKQIKRMNFSPVVIPSHNLRVKNQNRTMSLVVYRGKNVIEKINFVPDNWQESDFSSMISWFACNITKTYKRPNIKVHYISMRIALAALCGNGNRSLDIMSWGTKSRLVIEFS
jgi:hypothetical protein